MNIKTYFMTRKSLNVSEYVFLGGNKKVGCGPALAGLLVAPYWKSILLTDYLDVVRIEN